MLRDYEHALLGHTSVQQLLKGLAKVLTSSQKDQDSHHFGKIVSHFYLVRVIDLTLLFIEYYQPIILAFVD